MEMKVPTKFAVVKVLYDTKLATKPEGLFVSQKDILQRLSKKYGVIITPATLKRNLKILRDAGLITPGPLQSERTSRGLIFCLPVRYKITPDGSVWIRKVLL